MDDNLNTINKICKFSSIVARKVILHRMDDQCSNTRVCFVVYSFKSKAETNLLDNWKHNVS